ncbi:histidine kinase [Anaerosporomusa subterranea]|uniref:histidine kinase n=1 Tax=Anaerosporomusa subterranea TaxID=1794912 RepID=A0A154BNA9_ANASB|nr:HAMP domain-containing sensor histidine kinase [Anaerosporomusa subterranea]KYZ75365.1 histidine kinase [Anaerosporomusa subterranea]
MFRKTLIRLTATNSMVFVALFILFGANIYGYVSYRLFDQVDDAMRLKADAFQIRNGRPSLAINKAAVFEPRVFLLLRGVDGRMINFYASFIEDSDRFNELAQYAESGKIVGRQQGPHTYRLYATPYRHEEVIYSRSGTDPVTVQDVIAISIVDSEVALLKRLLLILLTSLIGGAIVIVLAGYYLARRALSPVRIAWEKQQQFVADASHELRTPLAIIKSNAELTLRHPNHTVEEEGIRITNVIRESMRMNKLVSSLLTLARADANQAGLSLTNFTLREILELVIEQFQPIAEMKAILIKLMMPSDVCLTADRERIHQLCIIILDNAIKYTTSGTVEISCFQKSNNVILTVCDTGCGIPEDDLPHIFDRFYRGDKARNRESGGTGLGLAIAKWIVEAHDGKIRVDSEFGIGTKIQVTLPQ